MAEEVAIAASARVRRVVAENCILVGVLKLIVDLVWSKFLVGYKWQDESR